MSSLFLCLFFTLLTPFCLYPSSFAINIYGVWNNRYSINIFSVYLFLSFPLFLALISSLFLLLVLSIFLRFDSLARFRSSCRLFFLFFWLLSASHTFSLSLSCSFSVFLLLALSLAFFPSFFRFLLVFFYFLLNRSHHTL